ncbi:PREDICTED: uncharacterized protein LOC104597044 [Nelumbo nucifera]|uniref:PAR1 protein n=2 Tax=Nelumbo nucifera TaxID=4432 RepID=A0A822Y600_NELNU|nr:PREDICTED: uncharacterized protein LOC104597044 [Nelumbo nucifera]DAD26596.1 TPA_asm: hypothetical protein HUJ06_028064 [Nelumbo nucifera]
MASASEKILTFLFALATYVHGGVGEGIVCEELPKNICAFSISSSGQRCTLETYAAQDGNVEYQCRTSNVSVENMAGWIETDECIQACGLDRNSVGISSDALLESQFTAQLCSIGCYDNCPNIVDLYFNLAAGEGVFLPDICEAQRNNLHREMIELLSNGDAPLIDSLTDFASPAPAPSIV